MRAIAAFFVCLGLVATLGACQPKNSATGVEQGDMSLGNPSAKVKVVEYASLGCPICARWNNDNFAAFKAKYIDTGKVYYTLREMLTGDAPIASAGFLLARCAGKDKYFKIVDAVFHQEADLLETIRTAEQRDRLVQIAQSAGFTEPQFQACVTNNDALLALNDRVQKEATAANINSTPTFVINGKQMVGYQDMATMDKAIAQAAAAAK